MLHFLLMKPIDRMFSEMSECGLSIKDISDKLGFKETSNVSNWKRRGSIPKDFLSPVAHILGLSTSWLITGEGEKRLAIPSKQWDLIASAGKKPAVEESVEDIRTNIRTLSLHGDVIDNNKRGELNRLLDNILISIEETEKHLVGYEKSSPKAVEVADAILSLSSSGDLEDSKVDAIATLIDYQPGKLSGLMKKVSKKDDHK